MVNVLYVWSVWKSSFQKMIESKKDPILEYAIHRIVELIKKKSDKIEEFRFFFILTNEVKEYGDKVKEFLDDFFKKNYKDIKFNKDFIKFYKTTKNIFDLSELEEEFFNILKTIKNGIYNFRNKNFLYFINITWSINFFPSIILHSFVSLNDENIMKNLYILYWKHWDNDKDTTHYQPIRLYNIYYIENLIENLYRNKNFNKILDVYNENSDIISNSNNKNIKLYYTLSEYILYRVNFNFNKVKDIENSYNNKLKEFDEVMYINLEKKIGDEVLLNLYESINWIVYCIYQSNYVEFLWRVYNFYDYVLNRFTCKICWINSDKMTLKDFEDCVSKFKGLDEKLDSVKYSGNKLKRRKEEYVWEYINTTIIKYFFEKLEELYNSWTEIENIKLIKFINSNFNKLSNLLTYRNNTIIAHWNHAVSESAILENLNFNTKDELINFFKKFLEIDEKLNWLKLRVELLLNFRINNNLTKEK